jgi:hypothetical protein
MKDSVNDKNHIWISLDVSFLVIGGMPHGSSRLRSYEVMKLVLKYCVTAKNILIPFCG